MKPMTLNTVLSAEVLTALRAVVETEGITMAELVDEALMREIRRRQMRREALRRNRLAAHFVHLEPGRG